MLNNTLYYKVIENKLFIRPFDAYLSFLAFFGLEGCIIRVLVNKSCFESINKSTKQNRAGSIRKVLA